MKITIFKVNQLGDSVAFLPVMQTLRALYPECRVQILTSPLAAPFLGEPRENEERILFGTEEFLKLWRQPVHFAALLQKVRRFAPDGCMVADDQGNVAHALSRLSGAPVRVGMERPYLRFRAKHTLSVSPLVRLHAATRFWELARHTVRELGGREWPDNPPPPDLQHLTAGQLPKPSRVVIHPGGSHEYKRWPVDRYARLAEQLTENFEAVWIESPEVDVPPLSQGISRVRPTSIAELAQTLASASLFVGNNSGPMNIAFALGRPSVIITGPSVCLWDPYWYPERVQMLRHAKLHCLPCDTFSRPALACSNTREPLACLKHWDVARVADICTKWHAKWSAEAISS